MLTCPEDVAVHGPGGASCCMCPEPGELQSPEAVVLRVPGGRRAARVRGGVMPQVPGGRRGAANARRPFAASARRTQCPEAVVL